MKRKLYAVLVATVVAVTMVAVPVMAASSPTTSTTVSGNTTTTTTDTTTTDTSTSTTTSTVVVDTTAPASAVSVSVAGSNVAVLATDLKNSVATATSDATVLTALGVSTSAKLASSFDLTYSGTIPAGGVQIPIKVTTGNVGDYAYILHRADAFPYQWEKVGEGVLGADLTVTGTFTSFSPVAIMLVDAASVTSTVTAPKTGN